MPEEKKTEGQEETTQQVQTDTQQTQPQQTEPQQQIAAQPAPIQPAQPAQVTLPENTSQRTAEQVNKLLQSNQQLYQQNQELLKQYQDMAQKMGTETEQRSQAQQTFGPMQQQTQTQVPLQTQQVDPTQFVEVDPETGEKFINSERLQAALDASSQKATQAEKALQDYIEAQRKQEELRQLREAYATYPQLDPNRDGYDEEFTKMTRRFLLESLAYQQESGGIPLSYKQAADQALTYVNAIRQGATPKQAEAETQKTAEEQRAENEAQKKEAEETKQQASAGTEGSYQASQTASSDAEYEAIRMRTRAGDDEALAKRLRFFGTEEGAQPNQ